MRAIIGDFAIVLLLVWVLGGNGVSPADAADASVDKQEQPRKHAPTSPLDSQAAACSEKLGIRVSVEVPTAFSTFVGPSGMLLSVPRTTSTKILRGRKIHADPASSTASISKHEITSRDGKSAWSTGEVDVKSLLPIIKVRRVEVNSCAAVAGLRKGDIIIALDGKQVTWKSEKEAMKYLEEASRSHVVISVLRRDEKMEFVCGRKNSEDSAEGSAAK